MSVIYEVLASIDVTVLKAVGMIISGFTGIIMSWISKRSVNYRKIDRSVVLECFLYLLFLNALNFVIVQITAVIGFVFILMEIPFGNAQQMILSITMSFVTIFIFWGLIIRTKRMKSMMTRAKGISKRLFLLINGISIITVIMGFVILPYIIRGEENLLVSGINISNWVLTAWWFALIISFIWRTAKYVYSEMRITLTDGEVIQYSCSPQMCRVHKNYIRLLKRNEKGHIIYERHISEGVVKQIEYFSENEDGTLQEVLI